MNSKFYLVTFDSSQKAMQIEKHAKKILPKAKLVPIPSEIHPNCGVALKVAIEDFGLVKHLLHEFELYEVEKIGRERKVKLASDLF